MGNESVDESGQEQGGQCLPGIPDEITLAGIVPKLPWGTFHILSSVSRGWRQAIQCRQVYDARVRAHLTQTLVVISHFSFAHGRVIGLYSVTDKSFCELPVIPNLEWGIPRASRCVSLDGKVYLLGGVKDGTLYSLSAEVYVMDVAGQTQWERCASMQHARKNFGCGVLDGRIYVCGGFSDAEPVLVPEVYDPKQDIWAPIRPMISVRKNHQVTALAGELFVHGGQIYNPAYFNGTESQDDPTDREKDGNQAKGGFILDDCFSEIYNPVSDEWRKAGPVDSQNGIFFMAEGRIHSMDMNAIHVYDIEEDSWAERHSFCLDASEFGRRSFEPWTTLAVDNELVTILSRHSYYGCAVKQHLLHSVGFGSREKGIVWRKADNLFAIGYNQFMCAIEL